MEQIYTIPVNEAFEAGMEDPTRGCPFCRLRDKLAKEEVDRVLGASMMEPDTRQQTNVHGFCGHHLEQLTAAGKRLPLALILESLVCFRQPLEGTQQKSWMEFPETATSAAELTFIFSTCWKRRRFFGRAIRPFTKSACRSHIFVCPISRNFCRRHGRG